MRAWFGTSKHVTDGATAKRASAANGGCSGDRRQGGGSHGREACLANVHCRPDEGAEPRQQPGSAQAACHRAQIHGQHERLGRDERLAAQTDHAEACRQRRKAAERYQGGLSTLLVTAGGLARGPPTTGEIWVGFIGDRQWDFLIS